MSDRNRVRDEYERANRGAAWTHIKCPLCEERGLRADRKGAMSVSARGWYQCHRCAAKGWIYEPDEQPPTPDVPATTPGRLGAPEGFYAFDSPDAGITLDPARAYVASRGLDMDVVTRAGVGACVTGYFAGRVVVPIEDWHGYVGRTWVRSTIPYLYPRGMNRAQLLYNRAALDVETDHPVFVVEGVFDALALWPHAVAVLGKPSGWQVQQLIHARRPVAVALDGDAYAEALSLALRLRIDGARAGVIRLPGDKDPDQIAIGELTAAAFACVREASAVVEIEERGGFDGH